MKYLQISSLPNLPFNVEEALNQLRINLSFTGENIRTIMITSATPNEGKSFISLNLWKQIAEVGNKVLLIDCDMRNSEMRYRYDFKTTDGKIMGIAHYLSGKADINDVIYQTNINNAYIIPVATNVANPTSLLESSKFKKMVDAAKDKFDYIILDTAPLGAVADALNISNYSDGSLLVVRSDGAPRKLVQNSVQLLKRTDKPLLGVVLNRVDTSNKSKNYYYNHYYVNDYYYGKK